MANAQYSMLNDFSTDISCQSCNRLTLWRVSARLRRSAERRYFVSRRARTAAPVMPALSPSLEAMISTPLRAPGMA